MSRHNERIFFKLLNLVFQSRISEEKKHDIVFSIQKRKKLLEHT